MNIKELSKLLAIAELPAYISLVEQNLIDVVTTDIGGLKKPTLRIVRTPGKRLRPALVIAAASLTGKKIDGHVIAAATAIELIHIASLVHDDIIDGATLRRRTPTINSKEGVSSAILTGDYLQALAYTQATTSGKAVTSIVATAFAAMCEGQMQELSDSYNANRSVKSYLATIHNKTALLMAAACQIGGQCAELPIHQVEALRKYGEAFGMAYQLVDDLLDILATSVTLGKPVGNDIKEGVYTLPVLLALQGSAAQQVGSWLGQNPARSPEPALVVKTLVEDGSLQKTLLDARRYCRQASQAMEALDDSPIVKGLAKLPQMFLDSSLKKQTVLTTSM